MRFIKKFAVGVVKSFGLVSSLITVLIILLIAGSWYADQRFANGYYSDYFVQNGFLFSDGIFFEICYFTETYPIWSIVIIAAFFISVVAVKILMRVKLIEKSGKDNLKANISYLAVNVLLNILLITANVAIAFNGVFVSYVHSVTAFDEADAGFLSQTDFLRRQIESSKNLSSIALKKIMFDADKSAGFIDELADGDLIALCLEINRLVDLQGGPQSKEEHYFRNRLNRAPLTLEGMTREINGKSQSWILMPPDKSAYHMFGPDGEYNLKFVSADGFFEAVYNKSGELLTDRNDAVNMGTYNYANPVTEPQKHSMYDVLPYYGWGNTPGEISTPDNELLSGDMDLVLEALDKYYSNPEAQARYENYKSGLANN